MAPSLYIRTSRGNIFPQVMLDRTLVVPLTGMEIYLASERTSVPSLFNPYQRSEWFGR